ncbi:MAG: type II toxin-antitoxin system ParD family antitoxin [Planctomycetes bacterium]|nr:type II toxin-antitoxin system ParD family antitoxin [Planctomycetota bacterium]MBI3846357.1 type II toxin-antitoxin system ParD family antitoxin [Planctomycetota bacterium]
MAKPTRNFSLTPELERYVAQKLKSGLYSTASEVIREALRSQMERESLNQSRIEQLRKDIQVGLDQLARGEGIDGEKAIARILAKTRGRRRSKRA